MADDFVFGEAKDLKPGRYVIIDGVPCRVVSVDVSKPGKHGAAKMRITAIGIFNNQKKTLLTPSDAEVKIPVIKKYDAQVISISGDSAQLMHKETYEMFDIAIPDELKGDIEEGKEVEVMEAMGQRTIIRVYKGD